MQQKVKTENRIQCLRKQSFRFRTINININVEKHLSRSIWVRTHILPGTVITTANTNASTTAGLMQHANTCYHCTEPRHGLTTLTPTRMDKYMYVVTHFNSVITKSVVS